MVFCREARILKGKLNLWIAKTVRDLVLKLVLEMLPRHSQEKKKKINCTNHGFTHFAKEIGISTAITESNHPPSFGETLFFGQSLARYFR